MIQKRDSTNELLSVQASMPPRVVRSVQADVCCSDLSGKRAELSAFARLSGLRLERFLLLLLLRLRLQLRLSLVFGVELSEIAQLIHRELVLPVHILELGAARRSI